MREVITLQLGNISNFVGAHFWNAQQSYFTYRDHERPAIDHHVHWRVGLGKDGCETFLPRTVVYDLKGGFWPRDKINSTYDVKDKPNAGDEQPPWLGTPTILQQQGLDLSAQQDNVDSGIDKAWPSTQAVSSWSDVSHVCFHPQSLVQLNDYELSSTVRPFHSFDLGVELFGSVDKEQDIVDRDWRPLAEECDAMQGIQVLTTLDDAWGGFASSYVEALRDEYPKSCIWIWGLNSVPMDASRRQRQLHLVNTAHSLSWARSSASVVVPLAVPDAPKPLPGWALDNGSPGHVSGLLAAFMETATLPSCLDALPGQCRSSLDSMLECLNTSGTRIMACAETSFGCSGKAAPQTLLDVSCFPSGCSKTANVRRHKQVFGLISTCRGRGQGERTSDGLVWPTVGNAAICHCVSPIPSPISMSYSRIGTAHPEDGLLMRTVVSSDSSISTRVMALKSQISASLRLEEREGVNHDLLDIADAYKADDWSSDSDESDNE